MILNELYKLNELSPDTLASYKKAAGADATAADAAGDYARGNKRFKGIVRATKKQFANDEKGVAEAAPTTPAATPPAAKEPIVQATDDMEQHLLDRMGKRFGLPPGSNADEVQAAQQAYLDKNDPTAAAQYKQNMANIDAGGAHADNAPVKLAPKAPDADTEGGMAAAKAGKSPIAIMLAQPTIGKNQALLDVIAPTVGLPVGSSAAEILAADDARNAKAKNKYAPATTPAAESAGRAVDAKGRTQQDWTRLVKAKFPDVKLIQAKMIDGPIQAILPDGRKLSWNKVEQGMAEALGDLRPKLGSSRDRGKSVRKWRQARGMDESGVAEGIAQDEAEEEYGGWRAEFVDEINYNTFEIRVTNARSKESANFIVRPVDMVSYGPTLSIETMDVHDLQTGQTKSWTNDDPAPEGPIAYAISALFYDNKQLQKKLNNIIDTHNTKGQDMMPGLEKRRSIGQEVDSDSYIDSSEKTRAAMAKMKQGVAEGSLNEFAPGAGGDDEAGEDPYKYPKPKRYNRSADYFGQFEADHFDREDFDDDTGVFKGYWGSKQIAYFKFDNPARTGGNNPGMGWYYEPESAGRSDNTNAAPVADDSAQRKQQELGMIRAFLKSGNRPNPDSQIGRLMKKHGIAEGQVNELSSDLLKQAAQAAKNKSDRAMDPKIHDALGGGYVNPLAKHYDTMSDKFSNRAAKVGQKDAVKKIASPAAMRKIGMTEGSNNSRTIIAEALITERLWSTAGRKLMEAQLTADQITQIFQQIQQDATAAGGNRTLIGKGKDAAGAVSAAWTDLKDKIYNSKPMSNFASAYDTAAEKLKQATGGDAGAMKYIQKYRDFATKHPMLQSAIYAALIAASGISGVGIAGAAALGLFKLVDQAIQGKDIRSAMWSGVKTGAQAFAAGQIGQALKGTPTDVSAAGTTDAASTAADAVKDVDFSALQNMASDPNLSPIARDLAAKLAAGKEVTGVGEYLRKAMAVAAQKSSIIGDMPDGSANAGMRTFMSLQNLQKAIDDAGLMSTLKESVNLSESQIFFVIGKIVERQRKLDEGIMDTIKGVAGKAVGSVVNYAKTKGTNLTTKITADKLLQAWKKAGSPMDSATVAKVIQDAGVPATSVQQVYSTMKIPFDAAPAQPSASSTGGIAQPTATGLQHTASAANPNQPAAAAPASPAAPAAPGAGAFGQMAGQLKAAAPKTPAPAAGKLPGEDPQGAGYLGRREVARQQAARAAGAAKPAPAKTPNFSGPAGYSGTNYTVKQPAKQPAVAESASDELQSMLKSAGVGRNR